MAAEEVDQSPAEHPSTQGEQHQAHHIAHQGCCTHLRGLQMERKHSAVLKQPGLEDEHKGCLWRRSRERGARRY